MQFSTTLTLITSLMAMATLTKAQTIQQELAKIPSCGMTCLTTASTAAGCGATDFNCQCGSGREKITQSAIPCIVSSCQTSDLTTITQASTEICRLNSLAAITGSSASASPSATGIAGIIATSIVSSSRTVSGTASGSRTATAAVTSATGNLGVINVASFGGLGGVLAAGVAAAFAF